MDTVYNGYDQILYITYNSVELPIGCLTSNGFTENIEFIDTTTYDNGGWKTSAPTFQSYSISFEGLETLTLNLGATTYSYDILRVMKRDRILLQWRIEVNGVFSDTGSGYITELTENATSGELLSFSGTIEGYGNPTIQTP